MAMLSVRLQRRNMLIHMLMANAEPMYVSKLSRTTFELFIGSRRG